MSRQHAQWTEVVDMMGMLKLCGTKGLYDETLASVIKRKHEPLRFVDDLRKAEVPEKQTRWIQYQIVAWRRDLST